MSKIYFLIFSFSFFTRFIVEGHVVNTGTVLFSSSDVGRRCWNPEEIAVLTTRMILQDILPDPKNLEISDTDYVDDIVEYFKLLFDVVQKSTKGRSRHITMLALSDLVGGYLQHVILSKARLAYYAGLIDYQSMEKLIQFYEELKWFLRTNGQGWTQPLKSKTDTEIEPIVLTTDIIKGNKSCCRNLIYYQRSPLKRNSPRDTPKTLFFPMPFFDSKVRPSAIAVPFRKFALRNIESKKAAYMVMKYYISVHNCMNDLHPDKPTVDSFRDGLYSWIERSVMPKLNDDKFYSAFGGILRVRESLKLDGAKVQVVNTGPECMENEGDQELGTVPGGETTTRSSALLIAMLVTIFVWFILGTLFICYRIRSNSKKAGAKDDICTDSSSSFGSSSRWSSSKRTGDTCRCCTTTEKSTEINSSMSSEFDKEEDGTGKSKSKGKSSKKEEPFQRTCMCDGPPVIDPKHSMKLLPSIPEMSENSSTRRDNWKKGSRSRRISFGEPVSNSSVEEMKQRKGFSSKIRVCLPRAEDIDVTVCPRYDTKAASASSKSSLGNDQSVQEAPIREDAQGQTSESEFKVIQEELGNTNENTTDETSDNTLITGNSPHIYACHSSLTGNYTSNQKYSTEKPFIFGYDFQTSTSSELSDDESDVRTSTTK